MIDTIDANEIPLEIRKCDETEYVKSCIKRGNPFLGYLPKSWLLYPDDTGTSKKIAYVNEDGEIINTVFIEEISSLGIRPAMWIKLE